MRDSTRVQWVLVEPTPQTFLTAFPELPTPIAHLCYHRGLRTQELIDEFLHPDYASDLHDPFVFRDMGKAVDRLFKARDNQERILVHGDYDADGVSGATVLADTLEGIGAVVETYVPHREREGYGFGTTALSYARDQHVRVIVTCDCGIANAATIASAQEAGVDVIVTDHHLIPEVNGILQVPQAYAILHPGIAGELYPYTQLTGGGVAFKLCQALVQRDAESTARRLPEGFEKWLLDCVAISTVADYGPLIGENRTLVFYGLVVLQKTRRIGLQQLYEVAGIRPDRITPATIGFQIAPRINAAGRIDHANEALALLRTNDPVVARSLAEKLNATNVERQRLVAEATQAAFVQVGDLGDRTSLVVVGDGWAPGIVGLVATKLRDYYHRPAIVLTRIEGKVTGSGRSIPELNIVEALRANTQHLATFGGHPQACGLTLVNDDALESFIDGVEAFVREKLTTEQLIPTLGVDFELPLHEVTWELVDLLWKFEPFGVGNPVPRYLARNITVTDIRTMGKTQQHCRLVVCAQGDERLQQLVCFRYTDICPSIRVGDVVDVVYEVGENTWNGRREIQLKVVDLRNSIK